MVLAKALDDRRSTQNRKQRGDRWLNDGLRSHSRQQQDQKKRKPAPFRRAEGPTPPLGRASETQKLKKYLRFSDARNIEDSEERGRETSLAEAMSEQAKAAKAGPSMMTSGSPTKVNLAHALDAAADEPRNLCEAVALALRNCCVERHAPSFPGRPPGAKLRESFEAPVGDLSQEWVAEELADIFRLAAPDVVKLSAGDVLIEQGQPSRGLYLLLSGNLVLTRKDKSKAQTQWLAGALASGTQAAAGAAAPGAKQTASTSKGTDVMVIGAGSLMGELSFLLYTPSRFTVRVARRKKTSFTRHSAGGRLSPGSVRKEDSSLRSGDSMRSTPGSSAYGSAELGEASIGEASVGGGSPVAIRALAASAAGARRIGSPEGSAMGSPVRLRAGGSSAAAAAAAAGAGAGAGGSDGGLAGLAGLGASATNVTDPSAAQSSSFMTRSGTHKHVVVEETVVAKLDYEAVHELIRSDPRLFRRLCFALCVHITRRVIAASDFKLDKASKDETKGATGEGGGGTGGSNNAASNSSVAMAQTRSAYDLARDFGVPVKDAADAELAFLASVPSCKVTSEGALTPAQESRTVTDAASKLYLFRTHLCLEEPGFMLFTRRRAIPLHDVLGVLFGDALDDDGSFNGSAGSGSPSLMHPGRDADRAEPKRLLCDTSVHGSAGTAASANGSVGGSRLNGGAAGSAAAGSHTTPRRESEWQSIELQLKGTSLRIAMSATECHRFQLELEKARLSSLNSEFEQTRDRSPEMRDGSPQRDRSTEFHRASTPSRAYREGRDGASSSRASKRSSPIFRRPGTQARSEVSDSPRSGGSELANPAEVSADVRRLLPFFRHPRRDSGGGLAKGTDESTRPLPASRVSFGSSSDNGPVRLSRGNTRSFNDDSSRRPESSFADNESRRVDSFFVAHGDDSFASFVGGRPVEAVPNFAPPAMHMSKAAGKAEAAGSSTVLRLEIASHAGRAVHAYGSTHADDADAYSQAAGDSGHAGSAFGDSADHSGHGGSSSADVSSSSFAEQSQRRRSVLISTLTELGEEEWKDLLHGSRYKEYKRHQKIIRKGRSPGGLLQVVKGAVRIEVELPGRPQAQVIGRLGAGEIIGEMSFLLGQQPTANVVCESAEAAIIRLPTEYLHGWVQPFLLPAPCCTCMGGCSPSSCLRPAVPAWVGAALPPACALLYLHGWVQPFLPPAPC